MTFDDELVQLVPANKLPPTTALGAVALAIALTSAAAFLFTPTAALDVGIPLAAVLALGTVYVGNRRIKFLPEGIATLTRVPTRAMVESVLSYADVDTITREDAAVTVVAGPQKFRLIAGSEAEPDRAVLDSLQVYLQEKVSEARALADDRATVTAYLLQSAEGGAQYRIPARPASALEAIARARAMPLRLRVEAAREIGTDEAELELSTELKSMKLRR